MEGTELVFAERGRAMVAYMPRERDYELGAVAGRVLAALLDEAMAWAVGSLLDGRDRFATAELRTSFRRPVRVESGPLRVEASVLHLGPATALAEAKLTDAEGTLFADAAATWTLERRATLAA